MNKEELTARAVEVLKEILNLDMPMSLGKVLGMPTSDIEDMALEVLELEFELADALRNGADMPRELDPAGLEGFLERHPVGMTARELLDQRKAAAGLN